MANSTTTSQFKKDYAQIKETFNLIKGELGRRYNASASGQSTAKVTLRLSDNISSTHCYKNKQSSSQFNSKDSTKPLLNCHIRCILSQFSIPLRPSKEASKQKTMIKEMWDEHSKLKAKITEMLAISKTKGVIIDFYYYHFTQNRPH